MADLMRSGTIPSWTPCVGNTISKDMPKRKLTRVEECLLSNNIQMDAVKCLNWKYMDNHPDSQCRSICLKTFSLYSSIAITRQRCESGILTANKNDPDVQRGNGKGKKGKKKNSSKVTTTAAPETKPTMESDSRLLFDDEFDDSTNKIEDEDLVETLVDLEQPLFEDISEDGSMILFDDDDYVEDKSDSVARLEIKEEEEKNKKPKRGKKKGKKGKKGKKARQG